MKNLSLTIVLTTLLLGCKTGQTWSGFFETFDHTLEWQGDGGELELEISPYSRHSAELRILSSSRAELRFWWDGSWLATDFVLPTYESLPGRQGYVVKARDLGQNYNLKLFHTTDQRSLGTQTRYENCQFQGYICDWEWRDGSYTHVCEFRFELGQRRIVQERVETKEVLKGQLTHAEEGYLALKFNLSQPPTVESKVRSRGDCERF